MIKLKNNQSAFTIVELIIASSVFSMVVLGAGMMIIQISRLYYKGIIVSRTQTTARNIIESISRPIQYESANVSPMVIDGATNYQVICIGEDRYTFAINKKQSLAGGPNDIPHAAWQDKCVGSVPNLASTSLSGGRDLLSNNMWVNSIYVEPVNTPDPGLWKVGLTVMYGDEDLIDMSPPVKCKGNIAGSQWCSVITYKTMVFKRIN